MQKIKTLFLRNMLCRVFLLYGLLWNATVLSAQAPLELRPAQLLSDTLLLQQYWQADATLDLSAYTPAELQLQRWYNRELAHEFVLSHRSVPDVERYANNNYEIPLHQRLIDNEEITPYTWKWVCLEVRESNGSLLIAKLRRPIWWLQSTGADKLGNTIQLDLPELEIRGAALVTAIWSSYVDTRILDFPNVGSQCYRPIIGWFQRQAPKIWNLIFTNGDSIGTTSTHPFYSLDQQAYVSASKLEIGERIKTTKGSTTLLEKVDQTIEAQWVYNLEVWRDHNFYVGEEGELVHNICPDDFRKLFGEEDGGWANFKFKDYVGRKWDDKFSDAVKKALRDLYGKDHICYDLFGFPDFTPFVLNYTKPDGTIVHCQVEIDDMEGKSTDYAKAARKLGLPVTINETYVDRNGLRYTWHHHQDGKTMMLVPSDVNNFAGPANSADSGGAPHPGGSWLVKKRKLPGFQDLRLPSPAEITQKWLSPKCNYKP